MLAGKKSTEQYVINHLSLTLSLALALWEHITSVKARLYLDHRLSSVDAHQNIFHKMFLTQILACFIAQSMSSDAHNGKECDLLMEKLLQLEKLVAQTDQQKLELTKQIGEYEQRIEKQDHRILTLEQHIAMMPSSSKFKYQYQSHCLHKEYLFIPAALAVPEILAGNLKDNK